MRFVGLILGMSLFIGLLYLTILFWGMGRSFTPFKNEFLSQKRPLVFVRNQNWVTVEQASDGLLKVVGSPLEFRSWMQKHQPQHLFLEVKNNRRGIDTQIVDLIPSEMKERVCIQSEYEVILKSLKELSPRWCFGSSSADRLRWKSFDSLGLVGAVNFVRDVYVAPLKDQNGIGISASIIAELRRRKIPLIVGPIKRSPELEEAQKLNPDGYLLESPDLQSQIH